MTGRCEECGGPVRVQILEGYRSGTPLVRFLCMQCADRAGTVEGERGIRSEANRLSAGSTIMLGGLCLGLFAIISQYLHLGRFPGFGVPQQLAACLGALLVLIGALLRVDIVAIIGTLIFGVATCADLIGLAEVSHLGLVARVGITVGLVLIATGLALRLRIA